MKLVVLGNCQARPVAEALQRTCDSVLLLDVVVVHLCNSNDSIEHNVLYEQADVILAQKVADSYPVPHVSTRYLKENYAGKIVTWPNAFFHGQNPDLYYVTGSNGRRLIGPTDAYHSRAILDLWKAGTPTTEISEESFLSDVCTAQDLLQRAEKSFQDLEARESGVDIQIGDYILENWRDRALFHTFNHPNKYTMGELCKRIIEFLELSITSISDGQPADRLNLIIPPFEKEMSQSLGFKFKPTENIYGLTVSENATSTVPGSRKAYSFSEYLETCFRCYAAQSSILTDARYTPL